MNIAELRSIYEDTAKECQRFAGTEFDDALALIRQDAALNAQLRALQDLSKIECDTLADVLLKFEIWQSNYEKTELGALSAQSEDLIHSIQADLIRLTKK